MFWIPTDNNLLSLIWLIAFLATLVHVLLESKRMRDAPFRNTLMVAVCFWPLGYILWVFYWPGTLWRKMCGKKKLEPSIPLGDRRKH